MIYILILIIVISIIYYKYHEIKDIYLDKESYSNYSYLKERGIKIETPLVKEYIIGTGEHDTPYEVFGRALNNIKILEDADFFNFNLVLKLEVVTSDY